MQTEKKGVSKREIVMLILMGLMGFTALMVVYVIIPASNRLQDQRDLYNTRTMERAQLDILLASEPGLREGHYAARLNYQDINRRFLSEGHSADIGRMLTMLLLEHNLTPIDQRLSAPVVPEDGSAFLTVSAAMIINGTYDRLTALFDTVEEMEYLRISRVSFNTGYRHETWDRINISFEVAMLRDRAD